jgi:hypothetical protein
MIQDRREDVLGGYGGAHARIGGRVGETDRAKTRHRAPARPVTMIRTGGGPLYLSVTWNQMGAAPYQMAGWIITTRHRQHELRGPFAESIPS